MRSGRERRTIDSCDRGRAACSSAAQDIRETAGRRWFVADTSRRRRKTRPGRSLISVAKRFSRAMPLLRTEAPAGLRHHFVQLLVSSSVMRR